MENNLARAALIRELRKVLPNLYSPGQMRHSPLIQLFDLTHRRDAPSALQQLLSAAIQALEPAEDCPVGSSAWRVYHVLHSRYIDQFSQEEVARDIFLSPRQLRRLEQNAVDVLADALWAAHSLETRADLLSEAAAALKDTPDETPPDTPQPESGPSGQNEELSWLERTLTSQMVNCLEFIQSALHTAHPLLDLLGTRVTLHAPQGLPQLSIHPTTARQALLHVITLAARRAGVGQVLIQVEAPPRMMYVHLRISVKPAGDPGPIRQADLEGLEMARKLVELSKGTLTAGGGAPAELPSSAPFTVEIRLPTAEQAPVLVIDDNLDTLHLVERYLAGTRYRFLGVSHPLEAIEVAANSAPAAILIDVMLPDMDGWDLLGRLRAHPSTHNTPKIICTILPQSQLALMLGAADFLNKPIRREALLSVLDRLVGPGWKGSA